MTTAADMERVRGRCENCDRPLATKQDAKDILPGEGEHLCWGACEPEDWRGRALKAEQQMRELAEVAARNVNDAQHLQRERDEARRYAEERNDEANKLQRFLNMAAQERDEARAEVERLRGVVERLQQHYAELVRISCLSVAERQRDADRKAFAAWLREVHATGLPHETPEVLADAVEAGEATSPLVTEGEL